MNTVEKSAAIPPAMMTGKTTSESFEMSHSRARIPTPMISERHTHSEAARKVGGTVGDYENGFYIEALRQLAFEEGPDSACFVALTYIIEPPALGESGD